MKEEKRKKKEEKRKFFLFSSFSFLLFSFIDSFYERFRLKNLLIDDGSEDGSGGEDQDNGVA